MTENSSSRRPQLLVSVQNECEAQLARRLGVQWIDLKNPAQGSLGCPDLTTARQVAHVLAAHNQATACQTTAHQLAECQPAACQTSVALGEVKTLNTETASELMQLFPIAKVGLAGLAPQPTAAGTAGPEHFDREMLAALDQLAQRQRSAGQLVLAAYADHQRAAAPSPSQVLALAERFQARYVLIDTFVKDGQGLFHWQTPQQLASLREQAAAIGAQLVVAGSLTAADWPRLTESAPAIVGVRGGVCAHDRSSELCPERLARWLEWSQN